MTQEELQAIIDSTKWNELGRGAYNNAFVSENILTISGYSGLWVLKKPIADVNKYALRMSEKSRAVRKWNLLNPAFPALESKDGWIVPYLGDVEASDQQITNKLIEIYLRTRIILVDGCSKSNFRFYLGEVICIDVDLSLRRGSIASDQFNLLKSPDSCEKFFEYWLRQGMGQSISIIQTLHYLEEHIADLDIKDSYISLKFLSELNILRIKNVVLSVSMMENLFELIKSDDKSIIINGAFFALNKVGGIRAPYEKGVKHAIHVAAEFGLLLLVKELIKNNSELLNVTDSYNQSPLIYAVAKRHNHVVEELIKNGVELNVPIQLPPDNKHYASLHNCTPLDVAIKSNFADIIGMLRAAGAIANWHKDDSIVATGSELSESSPLAKLSVFAERPSNTKKPRLISSFSESAVESASGAGLPFYELRHLEYHEGSPNRGIKPIS